MIKDVVLQFVKNEQKVSKNGKQYTACSIKVADNWINGFGNQETQSWNAGDQVRIDIFKEQYNGKEYLKFKTLKKEDLLEERIKKLEEIVAGLIGKPTPATKEEVESIFNDAPPPQEPPKDYSDVTPDDLPF